jgi:signal transduction histidine kinase
MLKEYVADFKKFLLDFKDDNRLLLRETKRLKADFIVDRLEKSIELPLEMAERVRTTVLSLKRFAAVDTGEMELVSINDLLDEALEIVRHKVKHKADVSKIYDQSLMMIRTLRIRLSQVFVNILDNAADAIVERGKIRITTLQKEKNAIIQISDDGVGIPKENFERLFTPYFTTKDDGLGMGLYISHRIISELRGKITVESEPGKGTTFTIRLPLRAEGDREKA